MTFGKYVLRNDRVFLDICGELVFAIVPTKYVHNSWLKVNKNVLRLNFEATSTRSLFLYKYTSVDDEAIAMYATQMQTHAHRHTKTNPI